MSNQTLDLFDFKIIKDFAGYNSASDKTKLANNFLIRGSKNVYKKVSGTIASRCGVKLRGEVDDTDEGVKSEFVWDTNVGTNRPLRVCNNKLQVESDISSEGDFVWYDLLESNTLLSPASTLTRFVFDTWWDDDEKTDRLLAVRGDDVVLSWQGGIVLVDSVVLTGTPGTGGVQNITITNPGTGYTVGNILTLGVTDATIRVTSISGGGTTGPVASVVIDNPGLTNTGGGISSATGGTGSSCTVNVGSISDIYSLTKQGDESWAEVGFATVLAREKRIIIDGKEYSYQDGEDTDTLTGVTALSGSPSEIFSGMTAIQAVMANKVSDVNNFDFDFLKTVNNQIWYGSYSSRIVYISADTSSPTLLAFLNLVDTNGHVYGDAAQVIMDNQARGIGVKDGKVVLFAGESDMYLVTPNENVTYPYSLGNPARPQYVFNRIEKKILPGLNSALGHEFIGNFGEYLVWLDQKNQLRALGSFANITTATPTTFSLPVQEELKEDDFTGGHLKVIGDTVHITAPNTGRDWMYQIREIIDNNGQIVSERIWQPPQVRGLSRICLIDGIRHGYSNAHPQLYQIEETGQWFDDDPSEEEIPYVCVARTPYTQHERRQGRIVFDMIYTEGYMSKGMDLKMNAYLDYQGATGTREMTISNDTDVAKFFTGINAPSLGSSSLGGDPLGDGILDEINEQELLPKFRAINNVASALNCFEYSLEFYSIGVDCRWELLCFGTNTRLASENPTFLRK